MNVQPWTVIDLFSGCGGMSTGFARRTPFKIVGAVDVEHGKPSGGAGVLDCNATYAANIGASPHAFDIGKTSPKQLRDAVKRATGIDLRPGKLTVLIACPPCTDFSRAKPTNHLVDSDRNALVAHVGDFVDELRPEFVVMENARELINGRNCHHFRSLEDRIRRLGYDVRSGIHMLSRFGLPQIRERAMMIASRVSPARALEDLWEGFELAPGAATVRSALGRLDAWRRSHPQDAMDVAPGMTEEVKRRLRATPADGGSWFDLARSSRTAKLLTPSMLHRWETGDLGSHPDVYGRMWWDRPAPTIKRECSHVGNGRYSHPVETRLLTVREMATLQGFPFDYVFPSRSIANRYRHIGDAVPPVISYQVSALIAWMKTSRRPSPEEWVLPDSALTVGDVVSTAEAVAA
jgi:DNA (cytosine-5)-methyltransferase 1